MNEVVRRVLRLVLIRYLHVLRQHLVMVTFLECRLHLPRLDAKLRGHLGIAAGHHGRVIPRKRAVVRRLRLAYLNQHVLVAHVHHRTEHLLLHINLPRHI